ncbi:hypothetical protein N5P37_004595 [Trichoderma harzianum]|nr:hypothetical protein N5P37_004595 [Trichoderma harzianum]
MKKFMPYNNYMRLQSRNGNPRCAQRTVLHLLRRFQNDRGSGYFTAFLTPPKAIAAITADPCLGHSAEPQPATSFTAILTSPKCINNSLKSQLSPYKSSTHPPLPPKSHCNANAVGGQNHTTPIHLKSKAAEKSISSNLAKAP